MAVLWDADVMAPAERADGIRQLIWDRVVRVEIEHQSDPSAIRARGRIAEAGSVTICSVRANATTVERTTSLTRAADDAFVFVGLQLTGSSMVVQDDREAVLRPGDLAIYDTRRPYTLVNQHGIHQHFFRVPVTALELPGAVLHALTATRLGASRPLADVTASHLSRVADSAAEMTGWELERVAEPTLILLRALLTAQVDATPAARGHLDRSLETRVMVFLRAHLSDPDLSAAKIAAAHHVSVRQLYRVLNAAGVGLGDWIRRERLEAARRDLTESDRTQTIAAVAHRWGFADITHFGRAFKAVYGLTPREWRNAHHRAVVPPVAPVRAGTHG